MPTLTITTTSNQAQRIATAFGRLKNRKTPRPERLPRDATAAEVKADVIDFVKQVVINHEQDVAMEAARSTVPDIDPT